MNLPAGWTPFGLDLFPNRWTPFRFTIGFVAFDFSDGTFAMQVRPYPDAETVLLTLGNAPPGTQGISATTVTGTPWIKSQITIEIYQETLENFPFPSPRGSDLVASWDMHITGAGMPKRRWFQGAFNLRTGSTHV